MTDSLRKQVEQVIIDHFDPSIMGRAQAVDDIMASIAAHNEALLARVPQRVIIAQSAPSVDDDLFEGLDT